MSTTQTTTTTVPEMPPHVPTKQSVQPVVLTDARVKFRDLPGYLLKDVYRIAYKAWLVMLVAPVATAGAFTPGFWQTVCLVIGASLLTGGQPFLKAKHRVNGTIR